MPGDGFKVGSAYIEVDADAEAAIAKIEKQLAAARRRLERAADTGMSGVPDVAEKVGRESGKRLGKGFDTQASEEIGKSPKTKKSTESIADRTQAQFKGLVFAGAFAGLPVAAAAAGVATVASLAIIPAAFVGIAAKLQAGNEGVAQSYQRLGETATGVMTRASSVLSGDLIRGTDQLTKSMGKLEPAMTGAFRNSAPAVDGLVKAATVLADEAMPGVLTATTKTNVVMKATEDLSRSVGRGITDFFQNASRGADGAAVSTAAFGGIVQDAAGFLGTLLANLSSAGGSVLPMFRAGLQTVYAILEQVTSGGMSPLVSGVQGFMTATTGALTLVLGFSQALGGWLGPLAAVVGAFKAVDMLTFGKLTGALAAQFAGLGGKIKEADGAREKFKTGMSGLVSAAISPAGLATAGLVVGLGLLGMAQQAAAQKAAEHKSRIADLSSALRESNGVINENVRATAAKTLADTEVSGVGKNYLTVARELGLSIPKVTDAYLGNTAAGNDLVASLDGIIKSGTSTVNTTRGVITTHDDAATAAIAMKRAMTDLNGEYGSSVQRNKDLAAAAANSATSLSNMSPAFAAAQQAAGELASAYTTLYSPMSTVADRGNALITILDRLAGRTPSYEEAIQGLNDTLRAMADELAGGMDHAKGWGDALLNADGTVSTFTENGSNLQNRLVSLQSGFANAGASIMELVKGGMTYNSAAKQTQDTLQVQRDRFVDLASQMGLTRDQASQLADKYGLLPGKVVTEVTNLGTAVTSAAQVTDLDAKIKSLPPNTPVRITSITAEAEQKLVDLGYTVTHMPDGTVLVMANTGQAISGANEVESRVQAIRDKTVYINVVATGVASAAAAVAGIAGRAAAAVSHDGGYVGHHPGLRARRTGGPTPMVPGLRGATLFGETGPEIGFPSRSTYVATALQTARMARDASTPARGADSTSTMTIERAGRSVTINNYITAPPSMDIDALAVKVSRAVERKLKGGS